MWKQCIPAASAEVLTITADINLNGVLIFFITVCCDDNIDVAAGAR